MVEERVTDGYRIAELLASEIDGRQSGALADLAVANADRTVQGTPDGERAYDVRLLEGERDPRREPTPDDAGELFARIFVHEAGATLALVEASTAAAETAEAAGLETDLEWLAAGLAIGLEYGAQSKRAIDVLEAALADPAVVDRDPAGGTGGPDGNG